MRRRIEHRGLIVPQRPAVHAARVEVAGEVDVREQLARAQERDGLHVTSDGSAVGVRDPLDQAHVVQVDDGDRALRCGIDVVANGRLHRAFVRSAHKGRVAGHDGRARGARSEIAAVKLGDAAAVSHGQLVYDAVLGHHEHLVAAGQGDDARVDLDAQGQLAEHRAVSHVEGAHRAGRIGDHAHRAAVQVRHAVPIEAALLVGVAPLHGAVGKVHAAQHAAHTHVPAVHVRGGLHHTAVAHAQDGVALMVCALPLEEPSGDRPLRTQDEGLESAARLGHHDHAVGEHRTAVVVGIGVQGHAVLDLARAHAAHLQDALAGIVGDRDVDVIAIHEQVRDVHEVDAHGVGAGEALLEVGRPGQRRGVVRRVHALDHRTAAVAVRAPKALGALDRGGSEGAVGPHDLMLLVQSHAVGAHRGGLAIDIQVPKRACGLVVAQGLAREGAVDAGQVQAVFRGLDVVGQTAVGQCRARHVGGREASGNALVLQRRVQHGLAIGTGADEADADHRGGIFRGMGLCRHGRALRQRDGRHVGKRDHARQRERRHAPGQGGPGLGIRRNHDELQSLRLSRI